MPIVTQVTIIEFAPVIKYYVHRIKIVPYVSRNCPKRSSSVLCSSIIRTI